MSRARRPATGLVANLSRVQRGIPDDRSGGEHGCAVRGLCLSGFSSVHLGDTGCLGAHWADDEDEWKKNKEVIITEAKKILDQRPTGLTGLSMDRFAKQARTFNKGKLRNILKSIPKFMVNILEKGYGIKMPPQRKLPEWLVKRNRNKKTKSGKKVGRRNTRR